MQLLQGQHVLVLGLGVSGLSMARWCARQGAQLTVADTRAQPPELAALRAALPQARFIHGALDAALLKDAGELHAVFKSPGLSHHATHEIFAAASSLGLRVDTELGLFAQALQALQQEQQYQPKVLAITGTNGKTTVTSLTAHLLAWSAKSVRMAGNVGPALLDTLSDALDKQALPEVWVLELSSFQLDMPTSMNASAATVLNLTQDHLDWHGNMQAYAAAKARIFGPTSLMVLNRDDPMVMDLLAQPVHHKGPMRAYITFGAGMPQRPGDFGLEDVAGMVWLVRALEADETQRKTRSKPRAVPVLPKAEDGLEAGVGTGVSHPLEQEELHIQRLMPADALRIQGLHNATNALAALALCTAVDCPLGPILFGLREYRGEPHRVESLGVLNGVEYFDDSKGTNVGASVAALRGLGQARKVVLIAGGEGKGQDFSPLMEPVARYARAVILIGRDANLLQQALGASEVPLVHADSMQGAVLQACALAHAGDAVLMSPACASFDMFDNYEHRAQVFCAAVQELALNAGVEMQVQT